MEFRSKTVVDAITFDEFIQYGIKNVGNVVNGLPWSFVYKGFPVTNENDECYLIPLSNGVLRFTPNEMLIIEDSTSIFLCKRDEFELAYEKNTCSYKIDHPNDNGYSDLKGYYYECNECGANYIDIEAAEEYIYCPYCGRKITSYDSLQCINCKSSEWDGDGWICGNKVGKYSYDDIEDVNFGGCKEYVHEEKTLQEETTFKLRGIEKP